jgi:RHS repeat-associated protein
VARSEAGNNIVYVHAGQQVIADYARGAASAAPSFRYVYGSYVDEPLLRHAGTGTTLPTSGTAALYYHRNQQYSIVGLSDAAGALVERYAYTAYGELTILAPDRTLRATSSFQNRYTYTGREWDPTLRLYYFRARWLEPKAGRFIGRDPLGYVDGMGLYGAYFAVWGLDPNGLKIARYVEAQGWRYYLPGSATLTWELDNLEIEKIRELQGFIEACQASIEYTTYLDPVNQWEEPCCGRCLTNEAGQVIQALKNQIAWARDYQDEIIYWDPLTDPAFAVLSLGGHPGEGTRRTFNFDAYEGNEQSLDDRLEYALLPLFACMGQSFRPIIEPGSALSPVPRGALGGRSGKSGRNTSETHTPGRGHNGKSKPQRTKRFQRNAAKKRCTQEQEYEAAKTRWEQLDGKAKKILQDLHPDNFKPGRKDYE